MTVYVDNYRCPTTVGRLNGRWSHLTADTPDELQTFAARLGLRQAWFQARCRYATCPAPDGICVHYHYDVVDTMRTRAIHAGAIPIDIRDFGQLITARRTALRRLKSTDTTELFVAVTTEHEPLPRHSAPGLGIVPDTDDGTGRARYSIVHLGSGLAVFGCVTSRCSTHLHQAVATMAGCGIDWTRPADVLKADEKLGVLRQDLMDELGLCFDPETAQAISCLGDRLGTAAAV